MRIGLTQQIFITAVLLMLLGDLSAQERPLNIAGVYPHLTMHNDENFVGRSIHSMISRLGKVHVDRDHLWHMNHIADFCQVESTDDACDLLMATRFLKVELEDEASVQAGVDWWLEMTGSGGEGMVVKPLDFVTVTKSKKKVQGSEESREVTNLCQPAVKVRGREYLRIIYGPDYDTQKNLDRLRNRHLGRKRSLAIREFALGVEALERFVAQQPLRKVHECVFGVLALESEPVDPRL